MDAKKQTSARAQKTPPSFEQALEQLEATIESMESGDTPLAELLVKFEEGGKLLKICEARLKDAEMKIELLKKQKDGDAELAAFPVADRE
ncbi:exodeoxyribonuclease VII small subunit [Ereboglobus sp. PH5-10]|uniref:exodeoxyribonuclease VII small subunit n=1 Tax=Ereboglobus sp. PH5-10 TaxID=2940629 RepID=UPI002406C93F|nr:exodeoxyribonuclease VII small subunit [Ereboglobus sp. PH5-10]MDF9826187.1 exodeoxyribonuclease VII small subunit [Ereboglobus sp. PH5-10]